MKTIGLCGGSGSGKGTVAAFFASHGIPSIDADAVYHDITSHDSPCLRAIAARFGSEVVCDGRLNRVALRDMVFSGDDAQAKNRALCSITHRYVLDVIRERIIEYAIHGVPAVLIDAPMLFESGFNAECDSVIGVVSDENLRIARIMLRDGLSFADAQRRIRAQLPDTLLRQKCDMIIENNADVETLSKRVDEVAELLLGE